MQEDEKHNTVYKMWSGGEINNIQSERGELVEVPFTNTVIVLSVMSYIITREGASWGIDLSARNIGKMMGPVGSSFPFTTKQ